MKKIMTVVGARPQFIKAAPVSEALAEHGMREVMVHTGQHFDPEMSEIFFAELGLAAPAYNLGIGGGSHAEQTGRMLPEIEKAIELERPDLVLVYGDTNSTLAAAITAAKMHVPFAHVEAGLRSFNRRMPEEINRIVADCLADILFAPTEAARANLDREGISTGRVHVVGDVMYDLALALGDRARAASTILTRLGLSERQYVLATIHRAENTDNPTRLRVVVDALKAISEEMPVIWPLHPRTQARLGPEGLLPDARQRMQVIKPVGYLDMIRLESGAAVIVTDSGGVQKEAFFHGVPCVTVREETEWMELVELGWNRLAPPVDIQTIVESVKGAIGTLGSPAAPYGDGNAADRIAGILAR